MSVSFFAYKTLSTIHMTIDELLEKYRAENISEREKGAKFEQLMKNFLPIIYSGDVKNIMLWSNFSNEQDLGIDLVIETFSSEIWAVQCKFYAETTTIDKADVDSFISNSGREFNGKKFSRRIFISTSDNFTANALKMFENQTPPIIQIGMDELRKAAVDWEKVSRGEKIKILRDLRDYQQTALDNAVEHFKTNERGQLIMACGTGKTFTSLKIAESLCRRCRFLVKACANGLISPINLSTPFASAQIKPSPATTIFKILICQCR